MRLIIYSLFVLSLMGCEEWLTGVYKYNCDIYGRASTSVENLTDEDLMIYTCSEEYEIEDNKDIRSGYRKDFAASFVTETKELKGKLGDSCSSLGTTFDAGKLKPYLDTDDQVNYKFCGSDETRKYIVIDKADDCPEELPEYDQTELNCAQSE